MPRWNAFSSAYRSYGRWVSILVVGLLTTAWLLHVYLTPQSIQQPFTLTQQNNFYDNCSSEAKRVAIIGSMFSFRIRESSCS